MNKKTDNITTASKNIKLPDFFLFWRVRAGLLLVLLFASSTFIKAQTHVQTRTLFQTSTSTTLTRAFASSSTTGNLIVVHLDWDGQTRSITTLTDNKGNTYSRINGPTNWNGTNYRTELWYAYNITGGGAAISVTATLSGPPTSFFQIYISEYSGIVTTNPLDQNSVAIGNTAAVSSGFKTTTAQYELIYGAAIGASGLLTVGAGFTARSTANQNVIEDKNVTATGSYNTAFTSAGGNWVAQMATFFATASLVGTPVFTLGATSTRCQGAGTVTYTATATNTTGITYTLDAASLAGGNSIVVGTGAVTYVAGWSGTSIITASAAGVGGPKTAIHTVTITPTVGTPVFTLGATSTRCQGAGTVTYTATATNTTGITYTLDAASITGGNSIVAGTGAVTYVAGWSGTSIITASAAGCNGPRTAIHTVTIIGDLIWTGALNADWNVPGNWSCGFVPYLTTNVQIPNVVNKPVLNGGAIGTTKNIVIDAGSSLTVTGNTMQIYGSITNNGTFTASDGTIEMKGTIAQSIGTGLFAGNTIKNLTINNPAGVTLLGPLNVTGIVNAQNGNLISGGNLTLVSSAAQTALIDGSGTGSVTGNVTMQRYLASAFGYKYVSSPFQVATVNEFGDEIDLGDSWPTFYKYDESQTTSGWVDYVTPTDPLNPMEGYAAFFGSTAVPLTADITGVVNNGALSVTLYNNNNTYTQGFNLVGNPYPSPINWDAASGWTKTNIDNALYYFKASTTDEYGGTYSTYINGISSDGLATAIIPSLQGFFIHVSDGSYPVTGTLGLNNSVRITDLTHPFMKKGEKGQLPLIRLGATFADDPASTDPVVIYFDEKAQTGFDSYLDALKLMNTDYYIPNLYAFGDDRTKLSIDALPDNQDNFCTIPLGLKTNIDGDIVFRIIDISEELSGTKINISDMVAGTENDLLSNKEYKVYLDAGEYKHRFFLNFSGKGSEIPDTTSNNNLFTVYSSHGVIKVYVNTEKTGPGLLSIYNLAGQVLFVDKIIEAGYYEFNPGLKDGIYIVRFMSVKYQDSKKIFIQNP